jgi:hypothetical protein
LLRNGIAGSPGPEARGKLASVLLQAGPDGVSRHMISQPAIGRHLSSSLIDAPTGGSGLRHLQLEWRGLQVGGGRSHSRHAGRPGGERSNASVRHGRGPLATTRPLNAKTREIA